MDEVLRITPDVVEEMIGARPEITRIAVTPLEVRIAGTFTRRRNGERVMYLAPETVGAMEQAYETRYAVNAWWDSLETVLHESLHAASPEWDASKRDDRRALSEGFTELASQAFMGEYVDGLVARIPGLDWLEMGVVEPRAYAEYVAFAQALLEHLVALNGRDRHDQLVDIAKKGFSSGSDGMDVYIDALLDHYGVSEFAISRRTALAAKIEDAIALGADGIVASYEKRVAEHGAAEQGRECGERCGSDAVAHITDVMKSEAQPETERHTASRRWLFLGRRSSNGKAA